MAIILTIIAPAAATIIGQYSKLLFLLSKLVVDTTEFSTNCKVPCSSGSKGKQCIVQATLERARQLHLGCNENFRCQTFEKETSNFTVIITMSCIARKH